MHLGVLSLHLKTLMMLCLRLRNYFFTDIWDAHAPVKTTRRKKKIVPWITQVVNECRRQWDVCYKEYLQNMTENNRQRYKRLRNACNTIVRNAKHNFLIAGLQKPSVTIWKHLKTCVGSSATQSSNFPRPANMYLRCCHKVSRHNK